MTFDDFCHQFRALFVNSHYFDKTMLKEYFSEYLEVRVLPYHETVRQYAQLKFKHWREGENGAWLVTKQKRDYMREARIRAAGKQNGKPKPDIKKKIKKFTTKRAAIERQYEKVKAEIMAEREHKCAGCHLANCRLTFSHRIPRSANVSLISEKENIDLMCDATGNNCHMKVETFRWDELVNGQEIAKYIKRLEPSRYWTYYFKNKIS